MTIKTLKAQFEEFKDKNDIERLFGVSMEINTCKSILSRVNELMTESNWNSVNLEVANMSHAH